MLLKLFNYRFSTKLIEFGKIKVPVIKAPWILEEDFEKALNSLKFKQWVKNFNTRDIQIKSVTVQLIQLFNQKNIGFINLDVEAYQGQLKLPGYTFIRGDAVAILLRINNKLVLTQQCRVPIGKISFECPAGMVDENQNLKSVACQELKEECGIEITFKDMNFLGSITTSPGGCDEKIHLYYVEKNISDEQFKKILNKMHGDKHENIKLIVQEFTWDNIFKTEDSKLICAAALYFSKKGS